MVHLRRAVNKVTWDDCSFPIHCNPIEFQIRK